MTEGWTIGDFDVDVSNTKLLPCMRHKFALSYQAMLGSLYSIAIGVIGNPPSALM